MQVVLDDLTIYCKSKFTQHNIEDIHDNWNYTAAPETNININSRKNMYIKSEKNRIVFS